MLCLGGNKGKMRGMPRPAGDDVTTLDYFHGVMSRTPAVNVLTESGLTDGLYLLRLSPRDANQCAIAICYHKSVYHYAIEIRPTDGKYKIEGGQWHSNIRELIRCHSKSKSGMVCRVTTPCKRPIGKGPYVWPGVTSDQLMREAERELYIQQDSRSGPESDTKLRERIVSHVKRDFYKLQPWYFRDMNRAEAEASLLDQNHTVKDGRFLVRMNGENMNVLSVVYRSDVIHYQISTRTTAGGDKFYIDGLSADFDYLMDLITLCHYDGLVCALSDPCVNRTAVRRPSQPTTVAPARVVPDQNAFFPERSSTHPPSSPDRDGHRILEREVELHQRMISRVKNDFHKNQPWFFGQMTRAHSEISLLGPLDSTSPAPDGRYLVRLNADGLYVLSLVYVGTVVHYPIRTRETSGCDKYCIDGLDKEFDYLIDLIAMVPRDGLVCPLGEACPRGSVTTPPMALPIGEHCMERNVLYPAHSPIKSTQPVPVSVRDVTSTSSERETKVKVFVSDDSDERTQDDVDDVTIDGFDDEDESRTRKRSSNEVPTAPRPNRVGAVQDWMQARRFDTYTGDGDSETNASTACNSGRSSSSDPYYLSPNKIGGVFNITTDQLMISKDGNLGTGQFSTVKMGTYSIKGGSHDVAVKTLKQINPSLIIGESELILEATLMRSLDNPYIIRLIGLCDDSAAQCIMLVMEIAPGGPLRDYLLNHQETSMKTILNILTQVANGMTYLESKNVLHRDLAARNILLVDEHNAKISDFGLSRALRNHQQYYFPRDRKERLPLKWYPPECFDGRKFDSKADIWSYGITMWEATSYASKPYKGWSIPKYTTFIKAGKRLPKPDRCPKDVFQIMQCCWKHTKNDRPSFHEILEKLNAIQPSA